MKKLISLLLAVLLLSCTACMASGEDPSSGNSDSQGSAASDEEVNIDYDAEIEYTIWALTNEEGVNYGFEAGVAAAKEKFPNVTLNIEPDPQDGDVKIKTAAAAGTMPDFYVTNNSLVQTFKKSNNNQALDKWMEATGLIDVMDPEQLEDFVDPFDGHIYGFAFELPGSIDIVVNMDLLHSLGLELPQNYDEFVNVIKVCRENDVLPVSDYFKEGFIASQYFEMVLTRYGYSLWDLDKGDIAAQDEVFMTATNKMKNLVDLGMFSPSAFTISGEDARLAFLNGEALMTRLAGSTWANYFDTQAEERGLNLALLGYPFQDAGEEMNNSIRVGGGVRNTGYTVSPSAENLDVAGAWICYFSVGCVDGLYEGGYASQKLTTNDVKIEKDLGPLAEEFFNLKVESNTPMPWAWNHADSYSVICEQINKLFTGDYAVEDFARETDELMAEILAADQ